MTSIPLVSFPPLDLNHLAWRSVNSSDAYKLICANANSFGLTRICNITGLDFIGIPVYMCMRPRGRFFSISAGKGFTHVDAIVSAAMESIEMDVAERLSIDESEFLSYDMLPQLNRIPIDLLPKISTSNFRSDQMINWVKGYACNSSELFYLPFECVSMDAYFVAAGMARFAGGSNGLASSVDRSEAVLSAIYEVIERDSLACWSHYHSIHRHVKFFRIELRSIPFGSSLSLVRQIVEAGLNIYIIQLRNELNIPVFSCHILNNLDQATTSASGYGCHHSTELALNRAITEAAQSRACLISGSREDILKTKFKTIDYSHAHSYFFNFIPEDIHIESDVAFSTKSALVSLVEKFRTLGWHVPIVFDYPNAQPFSVVRVICPSLMPVSFSGMTISHPRRNSFCPPRSPFQLFCESLG